ncbi:hypothetical protein GA707_11730 [Nostocoides sp. F2B08]|uniref:hypothetical protein n=1 Tax=Nostocoides sp. F2B08 TaxID=2653936 RepID=UPI001262AF66|nr:hypothetical protein [Tetrasphaera sp. F2B08]KAB7744113.1 hypothetical protein GA707_11730 [Tetrasphaera sp. F2B08]
MRPARAVAVAATSGLVGFQLALAAGAPWGRLAWGGGHERELPSQLRAASGVSALAWAGALAASATTSTSPSVTRVRTAYAALAGVGAVMNAVSPSRPERLFWTPVAAAMAASLWRLARDQDDCSGSR